MKKEPYLDLFKVDLEKNLVIPYANEGITAGFASPAQDYLESIDLNKLLIKNPSSTFFGRVKGNSMIDARLEDGDIIIIDKSLELTEKRLAVCFLNGDFTVKYVHKENNELIWLVPANKDYKPIKITPDIQFSVWGIVTYAIKKVC